LTENAGHKIASMKIDYITLECAFLLNFLYVKASVLTNKKKT